MSKTKGQTGIIAASSSTAAEYVMERSVAVQDDSIFESTVELNAVERLDILNVMGIKKLQLVFSPGVNVIIGENSTGKTAVLKAVYALLAGHREGRKQPTQQRKINCIEDKIKHIYLPDGLKIGNIVKKNEKNAVMQVKFADGGSIRAEFSKDATEHIRYKEDLQKPNIPNVIYIPPKEIISVHDFVSLYDRYEIAIEEMYADVSRQLLMPEQRKLKDEEKQIIHELEAIMGGEVHLNNGRFYLMGNDGGKLEMGLLSEGYRKIAMVLYLIANGNLKKGSILLMDEPETNLNPKVTEKVVKALIALAKTGIQVIVTTHDYFVSQEFGLAARYNPEIKHSFFSLFSENGDTSMEMSSDLYQLETNPIMEQFDDMYDRENKLGWEQLQS